MKDLKQFIENEKEDILKWFNIEEEEENHPHYYEPIDERENRIFDSGMYTAFELLEKYLKQNNL